MGQAAGKLSKDEIQSLSTQSSFSKNEIGDLFAEFKKHDIDGNGALDRNEFISFFKTRLPKQSAAQLNNLFDAFDTDGSGSIDFKELVISLSIIGKGTPEEKLGFMFDIYDKDKSGTLEKGEIDELTRTMVSVGKAMGKGDKDITVFVEKLIQKIDVDKSTTITRSEWITQGSRSPSVITLLGI
ncbi:hypothetical protein SAMD00019534_091380 [Acytostelium subglobosum LB1]|uniref:hypothetical protein n=1 Tax=Acytostelium subglobosum LB1 TaxID=1410327 RepID=UPI000644A5CA|nr:hypothetical protein SAMD00019534_091380 [Acytostelium subglobosum LB1]GAM25963.1 hypothetical protein SAMD00019534_091380 [Acytostelium subglobosum LB1]|eukprot:XP_012751006.1 hypothetical protein SAMD00019534_091380 [Acytostelium subglobosum LB1]